MKKVLSFFVSILVVIMIFVCNMDIVSVTATGEYTTITLDDGSTLKYRNSNEEVLRLSEYNYPTQELRAAWVSLFVGSMPSYTSEDKWKRDYNYVLDVMQEHGLNCIIFHVRTHNNAFYPSKYNPVATWMKNCNFEEFDPLAWCIEETHRRGMEFHAWLNPYRVVDQYVYGSYPENNPASDPANILDGGAFDILDPGLPNVRSFLIDTCMEVVENYDVDAIHFDDYFYVDSIDDSETVAKYNTEGLSVANFRRKQVDLFIEGLHEELVAYNKETNKCVQLGISPSGIYRNGSYAAAPSYNSDGDLTGPLYSNTSGFSHYGDYLYSDTLKWINEEWIDYIMPQMYWGLSLKSASFAAVTRWWSWACKNKKVNLYCGIGFYMAESGSSGWGSNENEIEEQLLNAAMYEEIGGIALYSYNFIKSSNPVIKLGMELIKNDYYKKLIPCDVKQAYADMPSDAPLKVEQTNNIISWSGVDGARGYMVYGVSDGETPDKKNIDHIYQYTTQTSIEIDDPTKAYFVATVNRANVISDCIKAEIAGANIDYVISLIDKIPNDVTISDKEFVDKALAAYNLLTEIEKINVTNYSKLASAVEKINDIYSLEHKLDSFVSKINKHINTDRVLPVMENMTWSYKNSDDSAVYNLQTGERLKEYLKPHYITLNLTLTENGLTFVKEVTFNVGILSEEQFGIFYRSHSSTTENDASALSPDEIGDYSASSSSFIGWSNAVVEFNEKVLFIGYGNYYEIESEEEVIDMNWGSVAGVINNLSGRTITYTLSDVFEAASSNQDVVIVISDGIVKRAEKTRDYTQTITLNDKDVLVVLRLLDYYTLNNYGLTGVDLLNTSAKVINYNTLDVSEDELLLLKGIRLDEMKNYYNLDSYSESNKVVINNLFNEYEEKVTNADSSEKLEGIVAEFKTKIDEVQTIEEEFSDVKEYALSELTKFKNEIDFNNYCLEQQEEINAIYELYQTTINSSNNAATIIALLAEGKTKISEVKTIDDVYEDYKLEVKKVLEEYILNITENSDEIEKLKLDLVDIYQTAISNKDDLVYDKETVINTAKDSLVESYKEIKIEYIQKYPVLEEYSDKNKAMLEDLIDEYVTLLAAATTAREIERKVSEFVEKVDNTYTIEEEKIYAKQIALEEVANLKRSISFSDYMDPEIELIQGYFSEYTQKINDNKETDQFAVLVDELKELVASVKTIDDLYDEKVNQAKVELIDYAKTLITDSDELKIISEVITNAFKKYEKNKYGFIEDADNIILGVKENLISDYKAALIAIIENYCDLTNYLPADKDKLKALVAEYKETISNSSDVSEFGSIVKEFEAKADEVKDVDQLYEEKYAHVCDVLEEYVSLLTKDKNELQALNEALNVKLAVVSQDKYNILMNEETVINTLKQQMDGELAAYKELVSKKNEAKNTIATFASKKNIDELREKYSNKIDDAKSIVEIETILNEFYAAVEGENSSSVISCSNFNVFVFFELLSLFALLFVFKKR